MRRLDLDTVRHALTTAQRLGYREVEVGMGDDHFHAKLTTAVRPATADHKALDTARGDGDFTVLKAPIVGYYREAEQPLAEGREVEKGDVVGYIVALGIANDVESKWDGRVVEVLVHQDQPVEYGQPLARIEVGR
jgi:acetyl-CoA carboxylase biotin carboxyl carrier protein